LGARIHIRIEEKSCAEHAMKNCSPFGVGRIIDGCCSDSVWRHGDLVLVKTADANDGEIVARKSDCILIPGDLDAKLAIWVPPLAFALWAWEKLSLELGEVAVYSGESPFSDLVGRVALCRGGCPVIRLGARAGDGERGGIERLSLEDPRLAVEKLRRRIAEKTGFAAVDLSGLPEIIDVILEVLPRWGRVMLLGFESQPVTIDFYKNVHYKGAIIHAAVCDPAAVFSNDPELSAQLAKAIRMLRGGGRNLLVASGCHS
jgi:hypothetical protein